VADIVDQAQEREEAQRDAALASFRHKPIAAPSSGVCLDCGDEIPPGRRQALPHARRCIDCQELRERAAK